jgi:hypothetical protein
LLTSWVSNLSVDYLLHLNSSSSATQPDQSRSPVSRLNRIMCGCWYTKQ